MVVIAGQKVMLDYLIDQPGGIDSSAVLVCKFKHEAFEAWEIKGTKAFSLKMTVPCMSTSALSAKTVPAGKFNAITKFDDTVTIDPTTLFNYHGEGETAKSQEDWAPSKCPITKC